MEKIKHKGFIFGFIICYLFVVLITIEDFDLFDLPVYILSTLIVAGMLYGPIAIIYIVFQLIKSVKRNNLERQQQELYIQHQKEQYQQKQLEKEKAIKNAGSVICPYCGAPVSIAEQRCHYCGSVNESFDTSYL